MLLIVNVTTLYLYLKYILAVSIGKNTENKPGIGRNN